MLGTDRSDVRHDAATSLAPQPRALPPSATQTLAHTIPLAIPFIIAALAFAFYHFTLAPTVLWGDDANFQRVAFEARLGSDGGGHWLWLQLAQRIVHLPVGDVAYRVNLLSAVAAAITLFFTYLAARALHLSIMAATLVTLSLGVAHTFWMHAVRAEVYTIFTLWMVVELWLWAKWQARKSWPLYAASLLIGTGLLAHQMALFLLPAFALLLWLQRGWLTPKTLLRACAFGLAGLAIFFVIIQNQVRAPSMIESVTRYFTHSGRDFSDAFFDFSAANFARDIALWGGLLGLQFVGIAGILGAWAIVRTVKQIVTPQQAMQPPVSPSWLSTSLSPMWAVLLAIYVTCVAFAISYRVNDQYVFYLPSYVAFAFTVGLGWDVATQSWRWLHKPAARLLALVLIVALPPMVYHLAGSTLAARNMNPLGIRQLPGREPNTFFLWPGKRDYYGAVIYSLQALLVMAPDSYLIADHTPFETLYYMQRIENRRRDVHMIKIGGGDDLLPLIESIPAQAKIYLADDDARYYDLSNVPNVVVEPAGPIFVLRRTTAE